MEIDLMALALPTRPFAGRSPRRRDVNKQHQQQGSRAHATTTDFACHTRYTLISSSHAARHALAFLTDSPHAIVAVPPPARCPRRLRQHPPARPASCLDPRIHRFLAQARSPDQRNCLAVNMSVHQLASRRQVAVGLRSIAATGVGCRRDSGFGASLRTGG